MRPPPFTKLAPSVPPSFAPTLIEDFEQFRQIRSLCLTKDQIRFETPSFSFPLLSLGDLSQQLESSISLVSQGIIQFFITDETAGLELKLTKSYLTNIRLFDKIFEARIRIESLKKSAAKCRIMEIKPKKQFSLSKLGATLHSLPGLGTQTRWFHGSLGTELLFEHPLENPFENKNQFETVFFCCQNWFVLLQNTTLSTGFLDTNFDQITIQGVYCLKPTRLMTDKRLDVQKVKMAWEIVSKAVVPSELKTPVLNLLTQSLLYKPGDQT